MCVTKGIHMVLLLIKNVLKTSLSSLLFVNQTFYVHRYFYLPINPFALYFQKT